LERLGLTINLTDGTGKGPRNAWYLTTLGQRLLPTATATTSPHTSQLEPINPHQLSPAEEAAWRQLEAAERALQQTRQTLAHLTNVRNSAEPIPVPAAERKRRRAQP
jgi:CelD/BcsL family acetyltransferase involved in cellulose biosynthesis